MLSLFHFSKCSVTQSCLTLCDPMDYSPQGSSVYRIFQARILEWVSISFSRGSSQSREWTHVFCVYCFGRWILYYWATWEVVFYVQLSNFPRTIYEIFILLIIFFRLVLLLNKFCKISCYLFFPIEVFWI